jgi:hypothetical protein
MDNHISVLCSFGNSAKDEDVDLPSLYWNLNYTSVLTNSIILQDLLNAPRTLFPNN